MTPGLDVIESCVIAGRRVDGSAGERMAVIDPSNGEPIAAARAGRTG